jgi:hypothetical protein
MFVDRNTRVIFANQADPQGELKPERGIFVGHLPAAIPVANYSLEWAGQKWTMVMWPPPTDAHARRVLMMHESWHRIQSDVGFPPTGPDNWHLDTFDGRYWLQLEWRALQQALAAAGDELPTAVEHALQFRRHRRTLCPGSETTERQLEMHEGLAEYTGIALSGMSDAEQRHYAIQHLVNKPLQYKSFTRSFAYIS